MHRLIYINTWLGIDRLSNASKFGRNPDVATVQPTQEQRSRGARLAACSLLREPRYGNSNVKLHVLSM